MASGEPTPPDPYAAHRARGHALLDFGAGPFALIVGYHDVRAAARDWRAFTSDTPFEVPIPAEHGLRPVRQLPIECDPPDHTAYRDLVAERFTRRAVEAHAGTVAAVVDHVLDGAFADDRLDVVSGLGVPVVNAALAAALGRPQEEADVWAGWGVHVFDSADGGRSANDELNDYLDRVTDEALDDPGDDLFGELARARFDGRRLDRDEIIGFGNLVFAGGRDTVISSIACAVAHLAEHPEDLDRLRDAPALVRSAVEEFVRIGSPLPFIGRHATAACEHAGATMEAGELVALGFAAANLDPSVFDDADVCRIDRQPNRHIAFGHGPHTCLGAHLARMELRVVVERVVASVGSIELLEEPRHRVFPVGDDWVPFAFESVVVRLER